MLEYMQIRVYENPYTGTRTGSHVSVNTALELFLTRYRLEDYKNSKQLMVKLETFSDEV